MNIELLRQKLQNKDLANRDKFISCYNIVENLFFVFINSEIENNTKLNMNSASTPLHFNAGIYYKAFIEKYVDETKMDPTDYSIICSDDFMIFFANELKINIKNQKKR